MAVNAQYLLNTMFPEGLADATYREAKKETFLLLMKKDTTANGKLFEVAVQHSLGGGGSSDFATARKNNNGSQGVRFYLPYMDEYAFARVEAKDMAAAEHGGGVVDVLGNAFKGALKSIRLQLAKAVTGDRSGMIAQIKDIPPTTAAGSFRVTDPRDLRMIDVGTVLQSNPTKTGSAGTMRAGTALVTRVDKGLSSAAGVVYFTAQNGWAPVANDFLYRDGDYDKKMAGVESWIPWTAPAPGENFFQVDRSVNTQSLSGIRMDQSAESSHERALVGSLEAFRTYNANVSHVFVNPYDFGRLELELGAKKRIVDVPNEYELGLTGIELADGSVVLPDPNFRRGFAWVLDLSTWTLMSMGDAPHVVDEDKLKMIRTTDADAFEATFRAWANVKCDDPSQNGVVKLPA